MPDVCRNCGRLAGLPSCMCWNAHGTFCESCNLSKKIEPPFQISESEHQAKVAVHKLVGSIFDA
jgi:hypothetical protein